MLKLTSYFFLYISTTCLVLHSSFFLSLLPLVTIGSCVSLNAIFLLITFCLAVWTDFQVLCCLINKNSLHQTCLQLPIVPLNLRIIIGKLYPEDSFSQRAKISPSKMFQNQRHNKTGHKTQLTSSCKSFPVVIDFLGIKAKLRVRVLVAHTVLNTQRCLNSYQGSIRWQHLSRMKVSR